MGELRPRSRPFFPPHPSRAWKDAAAKKRLLWKDSSICLVFGDSSGWCLSLDGPTCPGVGNSTLFTAMEVMPFPGGRGVETDCVPALCIDP